MIFYIKQSSIWCTCETSGRNSLTNKFVQCRLCRVSCCRDCISETSGYQLESHDTEEVIFHGQSHDNGIFQTKLRSLLPTALFFSKEGLQEVDESMKGTKDCHRLSLLSEYTFYLHRVKRDRKKWVIIYYARQNDIGEAVGEVCITLGELQRVDLANLEKQQEIGVRVDLTSFLPARIEPVAYGTQHPCVSMVIHKDSGGSLSIGEWKVKSEKSTVTLTIEGEDATESTRVKAGLTDAACENLEAATSVSRNVKHFKNSCARREERRWKYVDNWKQYPKLIKITGNEVVEGRYEKTPCEHTTNMSSLWIREAKKGIPAAYIIIRPNVHRTGPDQAIISSSISHEDSTSVLAVLPTYWQPSDALMPNKFKVKSVELHHWKDVRSVECWLPNSNIVVKSPSDIADDVLVTVQGLSKSNVTMLCNRMTSDEEEFELPLVGGQKAQQIVRAFNAICSIPIQKHAAKSNLNYRLDPNAPWKQIEASEETPFGCCNICIPPRPSEIWAFNKERKRWERRYESGQSREYHLALEKAPKPFKFLINTNESSLKIEFSPKVAAHQVARQLIDGRGIRTDEVTVSFRFSDTALQTDPVISPFKVKSCDNEKPTDIALKEPHKLYLRQQKVVTKMLSIENSDSSFEELEMIEHALPGSTGISMTSQAKRKTNLKGGVIAGECVV